MTKCDECKQPIGNEETVTSNGKTIMVKCFICSKCPKSLVGVSFYTVDEKRVCADCYANKCASKCAKCLKPIIGTSTKLGDEREFHPDCFVCHKCEKPIASSFKTDSEGHFECTPNCENRTASDKDECKDCKRRLVNIKFFTLDSGDKVCSDCYTEKHAEKCYKCKDSILEGQSHIVNDWRYHKDCFTCPKEGCGKYLAPREIKLEGGSVVCLKCE